MMNYNVGDFVLAYKKYGYDGPHYEWCTGLDHPIEYAIVTKIIKFPEGYRKFYVKFINGSEDCLNLCELKLVASVGKISATASPGAL